MTEFDLKRNNAFFNYLAEYDYSTGEEPEYYIYLTQAGYMYESTSSLDELEKELERFKADENCTDEPFEVLQFEGYDDEGYVRFKTTYHTHSREMLDYLLEGQEPLEQLEFLLYRYKELLSKKKIGGIRTRAELLSTKWKMEDIIKML